MNTSEDSAPSNATVETLVCESCGTHGVRMFRPASSFDKSIRCASCLSAAGWKRISDRFEWWVPACPTGVVPGSFWNYASVPDAVATRWYALPEVR